MASAATKVLGPKRFTEESISKAVRDARYAVRGAIVLRAKQLKAEGRDIVFCNIGNPQALGQLPLSYVRDVLSAVVNPRLLEVSGLFAADVAKRARRILADTSAGSLGAYTGSEGLPSVRRSVAEFITRRDALGTPVSIDNIFLSNGASAGIQSVLQCLVSGPKDGVLLPIPQYPLYSATLTLLNATRVDYNLSPTAEWSLELETVETSIAEAKAKGVDPRAIVVINPGNPTGACLGKAQIRGLIDCAARHNLVILADEVYQENVYDSTRPFVSFSKVLSEMESSSVELVSFHSVSKGIFGECGFRGGYLELRNIADSGRLQLRKLRSVSLCPNTVGQVCVDLMCRPPVVGEASFERHSAECKSLFESLLRRATLLTKALNDIEGIECQTITGAMYAFPKITLPKGAVDAAAAEGVSPDFFYCSQLLETKGICTVPGSGFGMADTLHFRTTILPPQESMEKVVRGLADFHKAFVAKYA